MSYKKDDICFSLIPGMLLENRLNEDLYLVTSCYMKLLGGFAERRRYKVLNLNTDDQYSINDHDLAVSGGDFIIVECE